MNTLFTTIFKYLAILVPLSLAMHTTTSAREPSPTPLHIDLAVAFDLEEKLLWGTSRITIDKGHELQLIFPDLRVTAALITDSTRENAPIEIQGDSLELPPADEQRTLLISYEKTIQNNFSNIVSERAIVLTSNWHPIPRQKALFSLNAQLPPGFIGLAQSDVLSDTGADGQVSFSFSEPLHRLTLVSGRYVKTAQTVRDGLQVYTLFFEEDQDLAPGYLEAAAQFIRRYEKLIGPFPYNHYVIAENVMPTGYGFSTFTLLGQQVIRLPFIKETSLGHEILHSWFGNSIDVAADSANWAEGLTTYLADMAYRRDAGEGPLARKEAIQRFMDYVGEDGPTLDQFIGAGHQRRENQTRRAVGYQKSAMLFHELQGRVGEEIFFLSLQRFYEEFKGRSAGWQDLQRIFAQLSGQDLERFFSERLGRNDLAVLQLKDIDVEDGPKGTSLSFTITQAQKPPYELLLPVVVDTPAGAQTFEQLISESDTRVSVEVGGTPLELAVDPDYDLLRKLAGAEYAPVWSAILGASECLVVHGDEQQTARFEPFIDFIEDYGCERKPAAELSQQELEEQTIVFLGASSRLMTTTFGIPNHPETGFTVEVRANPFSPKLAVALISSDSREQTEAAVRRLSHYGKRAFLHFDNGRIQEQRTPATQSGIRIELEERPAGIPVTALSDFDELVDRLSTKRVVYIGETHTSRPDHLLQRMLIEALHSRDERLAIGMEMFPRSSQPALDRFIEDPDFSEAEFIRESRYYEVWSYDYRLFRPIFAYARKHKIPLVALNIDRSITSAVFRAGSLDTLSDEQKAQLPAQMRLDLEGFVDRLRATYLLHGGEHGGGTFAGFVKAQALWDETMAESIVAYLEDHPQTRMVVLAGNQHTRKDSGIPPRVAARIDLSQASVQNLATTRLSAADLAATTDYLFLLESTEFAPQGKIGVVLLEKDFEGTTRMEITEVSPESKAGAAGIKKDDILIFINELAIHTMDDVRLALLDKGVGETIRVSVLRGGLEDGTRLDLEVELYSP